jgi:NDMA-dependent alcohol dehydrogenase
MAAVMWESGSNFDVAELDLDPPKADEVLVRFEYAGLCHSDEHLRHGDLRAVTPTVGGHEGAGVVEEAGPGVDFVKPGDHFVVSWMPACKHCRFCLMGRENLCQNGAHLMQGTMLDGTQRLHAGGRGVGTVDIVGSFSQWNVIPAASVVKIPNDIPLDLAALTSCGVPTGWGSAVYAGGVAAGDLVVVYGIGGIGINAVQGAAHAGAERIIAVDPVAFKRESALAMGATHAYASAEEAHHEVMDMTQGAGADVSIVTVGLAGPEIVSRAFAAIRKAGTTVVTSLSNHATLASIPTLELTLYEKRLVGSLFGSRNPETEIRHMLDLYRKGRLKLAELITSRYPLERINDGYDDMLAGKNLRGVLELAH